MSVSELLGQIIELPPYDPTELGVMQTKADALEGAASASLARAESERQGQGHLQTLFTGYYATLGYEDQARESLAKHGDFEGLFSIVRAFNDAEDLERLWKMAPDGQGVPYGRLAIIRYEHAAYPGKDLSAKVASIANPIIRTVAGIEIAPTLEDAFKVAEDFNFKPNTAHGSKMKELRSEMDIGQVLVDMTLANRMATPDETHDKVVDAIPCLVRPDFMITQTARYLTRLVKDGFIEQASDLIEAHIRPSTDSYGSRCGEKDVHDAQELEGNVATATQHPEFVERVKRQTTGKSGYLRAQANVALAAVAVQQGDIEQAWDYANIANAVIEYGQRLVDLFSTHCYIDLLPELMAQGQYDNAAAAVRRIGQYGLSSFITSRLIVAGYYRTGLPYKRHEPVEIIYNF